jgi:hypothetical protein
MRFLPWLVIGASVALAVTAEGCTDRACFEWSKQAQGACPAQADARDFFGECSDVKQVDSGPSYLDDLGGLCCYDVTHSAPGKFIPCQMSTTTRTTTPSTGGSTGTSTNVGTGGSTGTTTPLGTGGGPATCQTCSEAMASGNSGDFCAGASDFFVALETCACNGCATSCHDFCALGAAPTGTCSSCFEASCPSEVADCQSN